MLLIKGGEIHDGIHQEGYIADILVKDGKISRIGKSIKAGDAEIISFRLRLSVCRPTATWA